MEPVVGNINWTHKDRVVIRLTNTAVSKVLRVWVNDQLTESTATSEPKHDIYLSIAQHLGITRLEAKRLCYEIGFDIRRKQRSFALDIEHPELDREQHRTNVRYAVNEQILLRHTR